MDDALKIVYLANTSYWSEYTDYYYAAYGTVQAAHQLFPGDISKAVQIGRAWKAVNVLHGYDSDGDGTDDYWDNCDYVENFMQSDNEGDGVGDAQMGQVTGNCRSAHRHPDTIGPFASSVW
jgi:hypothetical protein